MSRLALVRLVLVTICGALVSPTIADEAAEIADSEYEQIVALTPDLENGRRVYLACAVCHRPEGWGTADGTYPQIAGQLQSVIIKQLADIRARNRDNPLMYPFSVPRILGGPQNVVDVAAYVSELPMTAHNGKGAGVDLELGGRLYVEHCVKCHGEDGAGNAEERIPGIVGQHYPYLMRQFDAIRSGRRKNADPKMTKQIKGFTPRQQAAVLDHVTRMSVSEEKLAPSGWRNPDFPAYVRDALGIAPGASALPGLPNPAAIPAPPDLPKP